MNFSDLNHLKNLSWYTTVPLLVVAWMFQDSPTLASQVGSLWGLVSVVALYFAKVVAGLFGLYFLWLLASVYIEREGLPLTLLLATFLLTLSAVGFAIFVLKPADISLPINIVWFAACGSIAFNIYQMHNSIVSEKV